MNRIAIILLFLFVKGFSQPVLVNTGPYSLVSSIAYDSINDKIFYNVLNGCPTWNIPCAYSYSLFSMHNLVNKHAFSDNNASYVQNSKYQVAAPSYPVNNFNSGISRKSVVNGNSLYTNFGYYFNRRDTSLAGAPYWTYSVAVNPSYKELSVFEIKNDSVFFLERDSTNGTNYYSVIAKNKFTGGTITYGSLQASLPQSAFGSIEGHIKSSLLLDNRIILGGIFTASVSGVLIARNLVALNIQSGVLEPVVSGLGQNDCVYDLLNYKGKIYVAGMFDSINGFYRKNIAVFTTSLNLLPDQINAGGSGSTFVDDIESCGSSLLMKGNFSEVNSVPFSLGNVYSVRVFNLITTGLESWNISLPGSQPSSDYTFTAVRNKLYIKNRLNASSPFYIYCFPPSSSSSSLLVNGISVTTQFKLCSPDTSGVYFTSTIENASNYNWMYSGSNATISPQGIDKTIKFVTSGLSTSGVLTVYGSNDCGLISDTVSLTIQLNPKPTLSVPQLSQSIICNPDSTLLQGLTTNTNSISLWRLNSLPSSSLVPVYAHTGGQYYFIVKDTVSGCSDSLLTNVTENKILPNSKLLSHPYSGITVPVDTVDCFNNVISISGGSDTSGVSLFWKSLSDGSSFSNPLIASVQGNYKLLVLRNSNNCIDSSLIVLVAENKWNPGLGVVSQNHTLTCSTNIISLNAVFAPAQCEVEWTGPFNYTSENPAQITSAGLYTVNVNNPLNGCSSTDTVRVFYQNTIELITSPDTLVCKGSVISLNTVPVGTFVGCTYNWSTGDTSQSSFITANTNTQVSVTVYNTSGCIGYDTVNLELPPDIKDSTSSFRSCNNDSTGTITVFGGGGIPPYNFFLNGLNYGSQNVFTDLPFGNHWCSIKDALGCEKTFTVLLNAGSQLPQPKFLASTKNYIADTVLLVDISIPAPDSVSWIIPSIIQEINNTGNSVLLVTQDTGDVFITMIAHYGTCTLTAVKNLRYVIRDSSLASKQGINSFSVYPNPGTGIFTIGVELFNPQDLTVQVWDLNLTKHYQQNFYHTMTIQHPVDLSYLPNGNYILRVMSENDARSKIIIINK